MATDKLPLGAQALVADPDKFAELTGIKVHPKAFDLHPQGNRLIIVKDDVPAEWGSIVIPEVVRDIEQMGMGWVLAVGPDCGRAVPHPGGPSCEPHELLYRHAYFGQSLGKTIRLDIRDRTYKSAVIVMTDRDLWCLDARPDRPPQSFTDKE